MENEQTGQQSYRYVRTGADHYSLAFTYDCVAWSRDTLDVRVRNWRDSNEPFDDPILTGRF